MNQLNENDLCVGYWEGYYSNGKLSWKGHYENGVTVGYWESYYSNGELESKELYI